MNTVSDPDYYAIEPEIMERIRAVMRRLYAPEPLSGDARRDLANTMDALLSQAVPMKLTDEK